MRFAPLLLIFVCRVAFADGTTPPTGELPLHRLRGPFASLDAYCDQAQKEEQAMRSCAIDKRLPRTAAIVVTYGGGQRAVFLAVEEQGWWIDEGKDDPAGDPILFDSNRGRGGFVVRAIADGGARLSGVQGFWRKPGSEELERIEQEEKEHPGKHSRGDEYYCFAVEIRCHADAAGPACTAPLPVAGRRDCGLGDANDATRFAARRGWDWQQQLREEGDELDVRRLRWRRFPTVFEGYTDWMHDLSERARTLAGRQRLVAAPAAPTSVTR
jgi:hypothetical protein